MAAATAEDLGKVIGTDSQVYESKASANNAGTTGVAMIAYVGSDSECSHGLAIALEDDGETKNWSDACAAFSSKTAVPGGTWRLPSFNDWQHMLIGCGGDGEYVDYPHTDPYYLGYTPLATKLSAAGGTLMAAWEGASYWTSTVHVTYDNSAWTVNFIYGDKACFNYPYKTSTKFYRAVLAF